jgi:hypothetical protein
MNKKEARKQLELALLKSIEDTLNKHNEIASKKIRKANLKHTKEIAKKFYKTISKLAEPKKVQKASIKPTKKSAPKKAVASKKVIVKSIKKNSAPKKAKK